MRVFNLAEELEKERKKNKELQGNIDVLVNSNCQLNEYIEQLENRTNKAVELLLDKYVRGLLNDNEVNNVVKILKGDNK